MTVDLKPEVAARLNAMAATLGLSVEDLLQQLIDREVPAAEAEATPVAGSGMVAEDGLLVYRTGRPLPCVVVDEAIRRSREERARRILGSLS
ncbi:MAG: hypothetical protein ABSD20_08855 [Terriglobales bacterium]|jgi:hypothetical protein